MTMERARAEVFVVGMAAAASAAITVRKGGQNTFEDVHAALFPKKGPRARTLADLKAGIADHIRRNHERR